MGADSASFPRRFVTEHLTLPVDQSQALPHAQFQSQTYRHWLDWNHLVMSLTPTHLHCSFVHSPPHQSCCWGGSASGTPSGLSMVTAQVTLLLISVATPQVISCMTSRRSTPWAAGTPHWSLNLPFSPEDRTDCRSWFMHIITVSLHHSEVRPTSI